MIIQYNQLDVGVVRTSHFMDFIPCIPIPKQSVKMGKGHGYVPKRIKEYCTFLEKWWDNNYEKGVQGGPIELEIIFCFPFKKSDYPYCNKVNFILDMTRRDLDNLIKPVKDSMQNRVVRNDSGIVLERACKIRQKVPGIVIQVNLLNQKII